MSDASVQGGWKPTNTLVSWWARNVSRRLPRLVWIGQEINVVVTFTEDRLGKTVMDPKNPMAAMAPLFQGALPKIEGALREIGVEFDKGLGFGGRDWEWDWSLRGPISIRFRGVCRTQDRREGSAKVAA